MRMHNAILFTVMVVIVSLAAGCTLGDRGTAGNQGTSLNSDDGASSGVARARIWYGDESLGR